MILPARLNCISTQVQSVLRLCFYKEKKYLKFHPIFYFSKCTTETKSKRHSFELKMIAIINAFRRFPTYLRGRSFEIVTDCNSLALALKERDINPEIERWVKVLQSYDHGTEHRQGKRMIYVDAFSRANRIRVVQNNFFERNSELAQTRKNLILKLQKQLDGSEVKYYESRNGVAYHKKGDLSLF